MKKFIMAAVFIGLCSMLGISVMAVTPTTETVTLATASGSGCITNNRNYVVAKLAYIDVTSGLNPTNTITIKRVRNAATNDVGSLTLASGAGHFYPTNTIYRFKGDMYVFTSSISTGSVVEVVEELNP